MRHYEARDILGAAYPDRIICVQSQLWVAPDRCRSELCITMFHKDFDHSDMEDTCEIYYGETYEDIIDQINKAEGCEK